MPWYDMPLERLREYRTQTAEPGGLDEWWANRLADARELARPVDLRRHEPDLYGTVEVLARRVTAASLLSVGLMDNICPPSTVFAAYNEITADKDIAVYPYSGHSVPRAHAERRLRHLREHLPPPA